MLFSSITFLFYFLPAVLLIYAVSPKVIKNLVLVIASLFFYAWGEPKYVLLMLVTITMGYGFGLAIEHCLQKRKNATPVFVISVVCVLLSLGYFKYTDFFLSTIKNFGFSNVTLKNIALPIGISFYSFQLISYLADVYRGEEKAQRNYIDLAAYISFFPQLIAGPIVRYGDIALLLKERKHSVEKIAYGGKRFIIGLSKKMLLANLLAEFCNVFYASTEKSILFCWAYAFSYSMQVYFDFSGYSDMAIGLGSVFGFSFPENFNYPFVSGSITEFWRRWHMTLGSWFRDYVYIPLGGNRRGIYKHLRNILIVWALTGLWHGASWNFVLWGLYYGLLLLLEKYVINRYVTGLKPLRTILTLILTIIGFVIFDSVSLKDAFLVIGNMFGLGGLPLATAEFAYFLKSYMFIMIIGAIGATPLPKKVYGAIVKNKYVENILVVVEPIILVILLILCGSFIVDGSFNPFLYFRF